MVWSLGGIRARLADFENAWTALFWRSGTAALFLLGFMLLRDGSAGTVALFASMGLPGLAVALCFAIASTSFVVALQFTTVANIQLMQAGVPLIAAVVCRILFGEQIRGTTWLDIEVVIEGVAVIAFAQLTVRV